MFFAMNWMWRAIFLILGVKIAFCLQHTAQEVTNILRSLNQSKYSRHVPPPKEGLKPLNVGLGVYLIEMVPIKHRYYDLVVDILLEWKDSRMMFNSSMTTPMALSVETDEFFWQPDLWILDESSGKSAYLIDQYVRLFTNGKIQLIKRLNLVMFCPMRYWYFPFDHQKCFVRFESYAFNNKIMSLNWLPMGVDRDLYGVHTTEFHITLNNLTKNYINGGPTGIFDQLIFALEIKRHFGYYLSQSFFPFNLVVILSMTSFWIDHNCVPARVSIPLIVVLTLSKLTIDIKGLLPFSRSTLFVEYYLNFSVLFVLTVLFEYCIVGLSKTKEKENEIEEREEEKSLSSFIVVEKGGYLKTDFLDIPTIYDVAQQENHVVHPIDQKCRLIYPLMYVLYNAAYFVTCAISYSDD
ncbi:gamma-aminobutyric acid receptor subunit beta-like [Hydractinia symbiolongicarpus]|uniref:gamma-aminobutyric acid receptor subunit beta-like n=1 Tax=Hydractinia symbiolongicarpus TaxID=13093 RepID=UPI00254BBD13|nr:gamma-aminobutyric acid receptor subunit beta-like [Hydractinia symbiolongicarpus]